MATVALSAISAVLSLIYSDRMSDLVNRSVVLPNLLPVRPDGNGAAYWTVKSAARTAGGAYSEGADMADGDYDAHARLQATLAWAEYRKGAKVSGLSEAVARANGSNALGSSVLDDEIRDAIDDLAVDLSEHSYSGVVGSSPTQLAGLAASVAASGSYAGIDPTSYTDWVSAVGTFALADMSFTNLRAQGLRLFKDATGMWPVFGVCSGTVFDAIHNLFNDQSQFLYEVQTLDGRTINLKQVFGGRALEIDGTPIVEDRHATASTIYWFGMDSAEYRQVPIVTPAQFGEVVAAVKALTGVDLDPNEVRAALVAATTRLQPGIDVLARTGDAFKAQVKWYGQLCVRNRRRVAKTTLT